MRFTHLAIVVVATWFALMLAASAAAADTAAAAEQPPTEWIDAKTGHRIIRLSKEPGSASLYFHQNGYWSGREGTMMIFTTPGGVSAVNLKTRQIQPVVAGPSQQLRVMVVGRKSGDVYYVKDRTLFATNIATRATRELAKLPDGASVSTLNADETVVAGAMTEGDVPRLRPKRPAPATTSAASAPSSARNSSGSNSSLQIDRPGLTIAQAKEVSMDERLALKIPMSLVTIDLKSAEAKMFNRCTDWLNHFQFSPTDPGLLMFCHEGPWHKVDRIWTIRTDGHDSGAAAEGPRKIHPRTMNMEIFGHEFWSSDGKTIWYDLQTPRGEDFWLAALTSKAAGASVITWSATSGRFTSTSRRTANFSPATAATSRWSRTRRMASGSTSSAPCRWPTRPERWRARMR
jgi:oligogalacturonide lyase